MQMTRPHELRAIKRALEIPTSIYSRANELLARAGSHTVLPDRRDDAVTLKSQHVSRQADAATMSICNLSTSGLTARNPERRSGAPRGVVIRWACLEFPLLTLDQLRARTAANDGKNESFLTKFKPFRLQRSAMVTTATQ